MGWGVQNFTWDFVQNPSISHYFQIATNHCQKHSVKSAGVQSYYGSYFHAFRLNEDRYGVSLRIQFECGKMRTRITLNTDTFHAVRSCHCHNRNGICHHYLHGNYLLFPELCNHSNYTWNMISIFRANDLNCAWWYFPVKPRDFKLAIFEEPPTVFRLKILRVVLFRSIVPYTTVALCSSDFFFYDTGARW